jgi:ATP-binding protein involved in chromosome partitioning
MEEKKSEPQMHPSFLKVIETRDRIKEKLSKIKHKIGVYSAKGGVGKTTTAINLAYTLSGQGFKVGLLDSDIDCPNVALFLGINEKVSVEAFPIKPVVKDGVKVVSTAIFVDEIRRPVIWRGPMITKMITEFLENVDWGELDYLIVDLSPGTSDAPLTIMQLLQLDGFVIVTNPQKTAAINSIKSGLMAKRMSNAVLGVIENMSSGEPSAGTNEVVQTLQTELLGTVRINPLFNALSDQGKVPVLQNSEIAKDFSAIVKGLIGK